MKRFLFMFPPIYVAVTMAAYIFGPWGLAEADWTFDLYLLACLFSIFIGVLLGRNQAVESLRFSNQFDELPFFKAALYTSFLLSVPTTYARTGNYFPDFILGIENPAEAYQRAITSAFPEIEYLRMALGPILFCAYPLGVANWSRLSARLRLLFVIMVVHTILLFVSMGVNRGIFDAIFGGIYVYIISRSKDGAPFNFRWPKILLFFFPLLMLALAFFVHGQLNRDGSGAAAGYFPAADLYSTLEPDSVGTDFMRYIYVLVNQVSIYLAQGYYGASLVYERGIDGLMFGVGHSDFLLRNFGKIFGDEFVSGSPIYSIEDGMGWLHGNYWFSIIPWIASDVGFVGVPFVMFILSYVYARSVRLYLVGGDWLSLLVSYSLFYMFFYFPANNYIVQSGEGLVATYVIIFLWISKFGFWGLRGNRRLYST